MTLATEEAFGLEGVIKVFLTKRGRMEKLAVVFLLLILCLLCLGACQGEQGKEAYAQQKYYFSAESLYAMGKDKIKGSMDVPDQDLHFEGPDDNGHMTEFSQLVYEDKEETLTFTFSGEDEAIRSAEVTAKDEWGLPLKERKPKNILYLVRLYDVPFIQVAKEDQGPDTERWTITFPSDIIDSIVADVSKEKNQAYYVKVIYKNSN